MRKIALFSMIVIGLVSCNKSDKVEQETPNEEVKEVVLSAQDIKLKLDSSIILASSTWDSVIITDDEKMANIKRLLDEISYCDGANDRKLKKLFKFHKSVIEMRYTKDNITSELIDAYDNAQDSLISETNTLAETTPNIEAHPLAIELMDEIIKADGMTVSKRGDYDMWTKQINNSIKNHSDLIKGLGLPYSGYTKKGIFGFED